MLSLAVASQHSVCATGKSFTGKAMLSWSHRTGVALQLIELGKPTENAYIESFNGRLRAECSNVDQSRTCPSCDRNLEAGVRRERGRRRCSTHSTCCGWQRCSAERRLTIFARRLVVVFPKQRGEMSDAADLVVVSNRRDAASSQVKMRNPAPETMRVHGINGHGDGQSLNGTIVRGLDALTRRLPVCGPKS